MRLVIKSFLSSTNQIAGSLQSNRFLSDKVSLINEAKRTRYRGLEWLSRF